jgi:carboxymethylenebutenolidase
MFFAGYAVAAVSADAAPIITSAAGLIIEEPLIANGGSAPLPAYLARPAKHGRHPVVIVVNEVFGIHAYIRDICRRLAHLGYVAIAPAFFYRSKVDLPTTSDFKIIMATVSEASDSQVDGDVAATTKWLHTQAFVNAAKIGITGFCWGGAVTWRSCMVNPDIRAGVAWYGRVEKLIGRASELRVPVLGLYGALDKGIPQSDLEAMRTALAKAGKPAEIKIYPDAEHGFHADYRPSYNAADAADGWRRMLSYFKAHGVG